MGTWAHNHPSERDALTTEVTSNYTPSPEWTYRGEPSWPKNRRQRRREAAIARRRR